MVDVRVLYPLTGVLSVEGGLGLSPTAQQFADITYLLPSVELQLGPYVLERLRPFVGVGVGAFVPLNDPYPVTVRRGDTVYTVETDLTPESAVILALGLDADMSDRWLLRASGRVRGTVGEGPDFFVGTFADLTAGLGYRF